jgi:cytochrome c-type biogenesis protein CcmE
VNWKGLAPLALLVLCSCTQASQAATISQAPPTQIPVQPTAPRPATPTPTATPSERDATVLTRADLRAAVDANLYTQPDPTTLARAANGSLQGQRVQIRGLVRRVQLGSDSTHYAANGWRARNWMSIDTAPGSAVDGQVSVLYNGDLSVLRAGQPVTVFGVLQGYDSATTNGFAAKPGPPLVVGEFVGFRPDDP